jgi:outer membrane protein TolC
LTLGVSGVLSVFDGFANIHQYKAARERATQAAIDRERACMTIMLEVIRARLQFDQAANELEVARQELTASKALFEETEAKWREGFLMSSERLNAAAGHAAARANVSIAEFRRQVAAATLLDVMGASREGTRSEEVN